MSTQSEIPYNFRSVFKQVVRNATPGFAVGCALGGIPWVLPGAVGVKTAALDLLHHATQIHPFILSVTAFAIFAVIAMQDAAVSEDVENWFLTPTLQFSTHLFAIGSGAILPLGLLVQGAHWGQQACSKPVEITVSFVVLLFMAGMSTIGLSVVEHRAKTRRRQIQSGDANVEVSSAAVASKMELRIALGLCGFCFVLSVLTASISSPTANWVEQAHAELQKRICTVGLLTETH